MFSVPTDVPATERARWLAEVSRALDQAQLVLTNLSLAEDDYDLAVDLHIRIEAARVEAQSLRLSRSVQPRREINSKWIESAAWIDHTSV